MSGTVTSLPSRWPPARDWVLALQTDTPDDDEGVLFETLTRHDVTTVFLTGLTGFTNTYEVVDDKPEVVTWKVPGGWLTKLSAENELSVSDDDCVDVFEAVE